MRVNALRQELSAARDAKVSVMCSLQSELIRSASCTFTLCPHHLHSFFCDSHTYLAGLNDVPAKLKFGCAQN